MGNDRTDQTIKLKDGRTLGYAEYGAAEGKPVFYFHGFPGSRPDWLLSDSDDSAAQLNARIIAVDRPGMGLSDFKHGRKILDWPDDTQIYPGHGDSTVLKKEKDEFTIFSSRPHNPDLCGDVLWLSP